MTQLAQCDTAAEEFIGTSCAIRNLREELLRLAQHDVNVLLQGESGTGKDLAARFLHRHSRRRKSPFIGVNCAAIHETLLESELFGHEAGAFTGARHATLGFLRAADGGTILLDEIADMREPLQSSLLRVLENRVVIPVGGTREVPVDIRVLAASHTDLAEAVRDGKFRKDLYYRLNVVSLTIPPLRDRREDIPLLVEYFLQRVADLLNVPPKPISDEAKDKLLLYWWPGNVRELFNVIQRAYVLGRSPVVHLADLPQTVFALENTPWPEVMSLQDAIRRHVQSALEVAGGKRAQAARLLGVDRKSLWRMMRRHQIQ